MTHSITDPGPIPSFRRMAAGAVTRPLAVTFDRKGTAQEYLGVEREKTLTVVTAKKNSLPPKFRTLPLSRTYTERSMTAFRTSFRFISIFFRYPDMTNRSTSAPSGPSGE